MDAVYANRSWEEEAIAKHGDFAGRKDFEMISDDFDDNY